MLRTIIIEDEKHSREALKNLLNTYCTEVEIIGEAATVNESVELIRNTRPDVVFSDIELQPGTGFEILEKVKDMDFDVVFTTAFDQYAIKAIKLSSIDYLLKPISIDELQLAVEKCKQKKDEQIRQQQKDILLSHVQEEKSHDRKICLSTADGLEFVHEKNILSCHASGSYTKFNLKDGSSILVSKHLKEYEDLLSPKLFMRVHNSHLINLGEVKKYVKSEGGYILMSDESMINISPRRKDDFLQRMSE